eukprot:1925575-Prymnesium_polylepis.1
MEAANRHEQWAIEILELCSNQDAATVLLTSVTRHWDRTVIGLAAFSDMKNFVAHRYCQNMCDAMLQGNVRGGGSALIMYAHCTAMLPPEYAHAYTIIDSFRLILHAMFPFCGVLKLQPSPAANHAQPATLSFYQIPLVKAKLRAFFYFNYVLLYSWVCSSQQDKSNDVLDYKESLLFLWTAGLVLDEANQYSNPAARLELRAVCACKGPTPPLGLDLRSLHSQPRLTALSPPAAGSRGAAHLRDGPVEPVRLRRPLDHDGRAHAARHRPRDDVGLDR